MSDEEATETTDGEASKPVKDLTEEFDYERHVIDKFKVPYGATLRHKNGTKVSKGSTIVEWNPHMNPILAEKGGVVQFENLVEDQSYKVEKTKAGKVEKIVTSHTGDRTPQIKIVDEKGESTLDFHHRCRF